MKKLLFGISVIVVGSLLLCLVVSGISANPGASLGDKIFAGVVAAVFQALGCFLIFTSSPPNPGSVNSLEENVAYFVRGYVRLPNAKGVVLILENTAGNVFCISHERSLPDSWKVVAKKEGVLYSVFTSE